LPYGWRVFHESLALYMHQSTYLFQNWLRIERVRSLTLPVLEHYASRKTLDVLENANKYPGPTGFISFVAEKALFDEVERILPEMLYRLHLDGMIYIHKLPYSIIVPYCTGHSISRLLKKGLKTPTIDSKPAKHFDTYVDHIANYLITMQHYFSGAQALSSVEWYSGPFIRADNLSYRQVKQNIQRLFFNLNYPSRVGMQTPFTNFTVTLDAPKKMLEGDHAIYDGKEIEPLGNYKEVPARNDRGAERRRCIRQAIHVPDTNPNGYSSNDMGRPRSLRSNIQNRRP